MSAKIDGVTWKASITQGVRAGTTILVQGTNGAGYSLGMTARDVTAPGTYPVGSSGGPEFTILRNGDFWETPTDGGTGSLVITFYGPDAIAGTFAFVAVQGNFTKDVTNGAFSLSFE